MTHLLRVIQHGNLGSIWAGGVLEGQHQWVQQPMLTRKQLVGLVACKCLFVCIFCCCVRACVYMRV